MKYFILIPVSIIILIAAVACSCNCAVKNQTDVPDKIVLKGDEFIISKVGKDFFAANIFFDAENSKAIESGYFMSYKFTMPQRDFVDEQVTFTIDKNGNVIEKMPVNGIPNCVEVDADCYKIDRSAAEKIAAENELPEGVKDWMIEFKWQPDNNRYLWHVLSVTQESGKDDYYKAKGEEIFIDPNTGEVLNKRKWNIF